VVDPNSLEFWEWFYEPVNRGGDMSADERRRAVEERWCPDLVLIQSPEMPGTAGEFHGYDGLAANTRELLESWDQVNFRPDQVHEVSDERYLVLVEASGRGRSSGVALGGDWLGHLVTLRDGRAVRLEVYRGWEAARTAAGLG
jgi:ketosteroid isomerase-like protein